MTTTKTRVMRLASCLIGYQNDLDKIAATTANLSQDLTYLIRELNEWIEEIETPKYPSLYERCEVIDEQLSEASE
jgi:hypothetical protein